MTLQFDLNYDVLKGGSMINLKLKDAEYYMDDLARKQLPFACSSALTKTSIAIGEYLAKQSAHQFHTLTPFSRTHKSARIGGRPSPGSSYATLPADKNHGIDRMKATLGNQHWGIAEQIDDTTTVRKPKTSKYLWVPLQGRKRNYGPKKALGQKGVFVINGRRGSLIVQRKGKMKQLKPLFLRRRQQTINPKFSMKRIVENRAQRYMDFFFNEQMQKALDTAR